MSLDLLQNLDKGLVFLADVSEGKVLYAVCSSDEQIKLGHNAGDLAKQAAMLSGGNGGGRPSFAQAGGKQAEKLPEVIKAIRQSLGI